MTKTKKDSWVWWALVVLFMVGVTLGCKEKASEVRAAAGLPPTWNASKTLFNEGYLYDLFPLGKGVVWAAGAFGNIVRYDGKEWRPSPLPDPYKHFHIFDLFFLSPDNGWAVGEDQVVPKKQGVMFHYDGKGWSFVDNPSTDSLVSIHFTSPENGWAVGADSNLLHYDGTRWEKVQPPKFCYLSRVFLSSPDDGWAVGNEGVILHYDGTAWSAVPSPTKEHLYGLYFPNSQEGWAVGDMGTLLHYQGGNWTLSPSPTELTLFSVYFRSPEEGYAVGSSGTILRYRSGKWEELKDTPTPKFLYAVSYENPLGLLVAGRERMVFNNPKIED